MYVDIYYSGEVVQKGATFPSRGACLQLNLSPTLQGVHSLMWNCWIMHLWVFAQSHTDPLRHHLQRVKHNKKKQTGEYNIGAQTDLVRCLLEEWTSISLLLNSFSSFRIAACGTKVTKSVNPGVSPRTPMQLLRWWSSNEFVVKMEKHLLLRGGLGKLNWL